MTVFLHTALQRRGGAARVADMLRQGLQARGQAVEARFELAEDDPPPRSAVAPDQAGQGLAPGDILHLHSTRDWAGLLAAVPAGLPLVVTLHDLEAATGGCPHPLDCAKAGQGCPDPCPRNYPDSAAAKAARLAELRRLAPRLVSPSRWLAGVFRDLTGLRPRIIPNGVPWPETLTPRAEARRRLGVADQARVVLFVAHGGERAAYKQGSRWREYWKEIKAMEPRAVCFAVGGDQVGREGDLLIWPYVDRDLLAVLMAAADVLAYPTLADNHPLTVLEAQAAALPVVSFAVGGVPEQIRHEETGLLVPPGDHGLLARSAAEVLARPDLGRRLGQAAREVGRTRFCLERMAGDYLRLYESMLREPSGARVSA